MLLSELHTSKIFYRSLVACTQSTYLYNSLKHVSQGEIGHGDI